MADILALINLAGIVASSIIYNHRAGFPRIKAETGIDWREFILPNLAWMGLTLLKCFGWWVVLIVWVMQGRPPAPWQATTMQNGHEVRAVRRVDGHRSDRHRVAP